MKTRMHWPKRTSRTSGIEDTRVDDLDDQTRSIGIIVAYAQLLPFLCDVNLLRRRCGSGVNSNSQLLLQYALYETGCHGQMLFLRFLPSRTMNKNERLGAFSGIDVSTCLGHFFFWASLSSGEAGLKGIERLKLSTSKYTSDQKRNWYKTMSLHVTTGQTVSYRQQSSGTLHDDRSTWTDLSEIEPKHNCRHTPPSPA